MRLVAWVDTSKVFKQSAAHLDQARELRPPALECIQSSPPRLQAHLQRVNLSQQPCSLVCSRLFSGFPLSEGVSQSMKLFFLPSARASV